MRNVTRVQRLVLHSTAFGAALSLVGCGNNPLQMRRGATPHLAKGSSPIIGGTTDSGHPAVGLLYNSSQGYLCSGTLIAPNVFLTAGHCTQPDSNAANYQVGGGTDPFNGADWVFDVSEVHTNPAYNQNDFGIGDTGILILTNGQGNVPQPMAWLDHTDDSAYQTGTNFTAVGYGITSGSGQDSGTKRTVSLQVMDQDSQNFAYGSQSKNTCEGDSGGPAIENINGVDTVIGTVSYGDSNCQQYGVDMRVDEESSFISQYANASTAPTPTPSATPSATPTSNPTPTPNPTSTPGGGGNGGNGGNGGSGNGNDGGSPNIGGCDVASTGVPGLGGAFALLAGLGLATMAARRRRD